MNREGNQLVREKVGIRGKAALSPMPKREKPGKAHSESGGWGGGLSAIGKKLNTAKEMVLKFVLHVHLDKTTIPGRAGGFMRVNEKGGKTPSRVKGEILENAGKL